MNNKHFIEETLEIITGPTYTPDMACAAMERELQRHLQTYTIETSRQNSKQKEIIFRLSPRVFIVLAPRSVHEYRSLKNMRTFQEMRTAVVEGTGGATLRKYPARKLVTKTPAGFCPKCGCHFMTHNSDGSCVKD